MSHRGEARAGPGPAQLRAPRIPSVAGTARAGAVAVAAPGRAAEAAVGLVWKLEAVPWLELASRVLGRAVLCDCIGGTVRASPANPDAAPQSSPRAAAGAGSAAREVVPCGRDACAGAEERRAPGDACGQLLRARTFLARCGATRPALQAGPGHCKRRRHCAVRGPNTISASGRHLRVL